MVKDPSSTKDAFRRRGTEPADRGRGASAGDGHGAESRLAAARAYDLWAPAYDEEMNPLQKLEARLIRRLLPPLDDATTMLDVGCGAGRVMLQALHRGARIVVGTDLSMGMLQRAAVLDPPATGVVRCDASALPVAPGRFHLVTCALMMGHSPDMPGALAEIVRALAPGGILVLTDFHPEATRHGWERTFTDPASGRVHAIEQHLHPIAAYREALEAAGLVEEDLDERWYDGVPVVFGLRARKPGAPSPRPAPIEKPAR